MKRLLFLGAAPTQIPPLEYAKKMGYYVITCDYLPDNPGHRIAHESHNVSTTDHKAVLALAEKTRIDGIVAYASDPAAPTAAFVGNKLGLPSNPYESVLTLARKDLFRKHLLENDFHVPRSASFYSLGEAQEWAETLDFPLFVKPVDSSGSKGVTEILTLESLSHAFSYALEFSREKKVVVEEKIVRNGYQVAGDGFIIDGDLSFRCWANEHFDRKCNGLVPVGESFPSIHNPDLQSVAHRETQRLLKSLNMNTGALNFDYVFTKDGRFYFLELGPRNGGNLIPEVTKLYTGVDMIAMTVEAALGNPLPKVVSSKPEGFWASYIVHSLSDGVFRGLRVTDKAKKWIIQQNLTVSPGAEVRKFSGSHDGLGTMILRFSSLDEMLTKMDSMETEIFVETLQK